MKKLTLHILIMLASSAAWGQVASPNPTIPPLPSGPLLKSAPDFSQWVVTYIAPTPARKGAPASGNQASNPKVMRRVEVIKTGPIRYLLTVEPDGSRMETWCTGTKQVYLHSGWKDPMVSDESDIKDPNSVDISKTDFPGCGWVSAKSYKGIQRLNGRDCIFFSDTVVVVQEIVPGNASKTTSYQYPALAYVDMETRLPVMLITPSEIAVYQFGAAPQSTLTIPAQVKEAMEQQEKAINNLTRMPPKPF